MARPLRLEIAGGRYHVTARGIERKSIFRDDTDRFHFLELLSEVTDRFGARVHAYVLMDNHFHLLVQTPEANLSRAMQWVNVSYSVWFNRRHQRVGHLFQGRFSAAIVEDDAGWQEVARYVHLNPVRVAMLKLGKRDRSASRAGLVERPSPEILAERLRVLREFRWSSYRGYAGYAAPLAWVWSEPLSRLCGGKTEAQRREALRQYTERAVRQGAMESPWARLVAGCVLGTETFARSLARRVRADPREQREVRDLSRPASWEQIIAALEKVRGEPWAAFCDRHGDWGRDAALWVGRRCGRLTLAELGQRAGGVDYAAVSQAVSRFGRRLERDKKLKGLLGQVQLSLVET